MSLSKPIKSGGFSLGSVLFYDQRDDTYPGSMGTAEKWWTRMLNTEDHNDLGSDVELLSWAITEASTGSNYFKVANDQTTYFPTGHRFDVRGSTGNDSGATPYIVTSSSFSSGETTINVASVSDATADGTIHNGMFRFSAAKDYDAKGVATCYGIEGTDVRLANISGVTYTSGYASSTPATKSDPLSAAFAGSTAGSDTVTVYFSGRVTVTADSVWELQQWNELLNSNDFAMGVHQTSTSHGGVVNFASLEIKEAG